MEADSNIAGKCKRLWSAVPFQIALVIVLGILIYSNTFQSPFIFDDEPSITNNHVVKDLHYFLDGFGYNYNPRRFIGYLTIALNYHWGGADVTGYHIVNLAIHLVTALLIYALARLTLRTPFFEPLHPETESGTAPWGGIRSFVPLLAALLFVVHPVQTQAVTYIVQRLASLATLFFLLSMVLYARARLCDLAWAKWGLYLLSLAAAALAMRTKETAFTLPLVVVLYESLFFDMTTRKRLLILAPVLLLLLIIPLSVIGSGNQMTDIVAAIADSTRVQTDMPRLDYLFTQFRVIVTYLRLLIFPANQNLDYDYPVYSSFFAPPVLLSFLLLLALFALAMYLLYRTRTGTADCALAGDGGQGADSGGASPELRLVSFGILWFFITLSVESSVIPIVDVIYEHRLYLPSAGAFIAFAAGTFAFCSSRHQRWVPSGLMLVIGAFSLATWQRNSVWQSEVSIWQDCATKSPAKPRALTNYGFALIKAGRVDEAFQPLQRALALDLTHYAAYNHLGNAFLKKRMVPDAIEAFQNVLAIYPAYPEARRNLGVALSAAGRMDEAVAQFAEALRLDPNSATAHFNFGLAHQKMGLWEKASEDYLSACRLDPQYPPPYHNLGMVYLALGRKELALAQFRKAVQLDPGNPEFRRNLATVASRMGIAP